MKPVCVEDKRNSHYWDFSTFINMKFIPSSVMNVLKPFGLRKQILHIPDGQYDALQSGHTPGRSGGHSGVYLQFGWKSPTQPGGHLTRSQFGGIP